MLIFSTLLSRVPNHANNIPLFQPFVKTKTRFFCEYFVNSANFSRIREKRVQSAECRVRSAECGVRSAECGVRSAECRVRSAECRVRSAECRVQSAECGVRSAECGVQSALSTVNCQLRTIHHTSPPRPFLSLYRSSACNFRPHIPHRPKSSRPRRISSAPSPRYRRWICPRACRAYRC